MRGFPTFRDSSPNHHRRRLLATENRFHRCEDTIRTLCQNSVLRVEFGVNSEHFLARKDYFTSLSASFVAFKRIFDLSNLYCFCNAVSCCLLVVFKRDNLRSSLTMILTLFVNFQVPSNFPYVSLRVPPYSLPNDFNFGLCASSSGASTSGPILHVPNSL